MYSCQRENKWSDVSRVKRLLKHGEKFPHYTSAIVSFQAPLMQTQTAGRNVYSMMKMIVQFFKY